MGVTIDKSQQQQNHPLRTDSSLSHKGGEGLHRQTLYHIAVKAGFHRKPGEVYLYIPRHYYIQPLKFEICLWISLHRNHVKWDQGRY